jgi:hypothetical protein
VNKTETISPLAMERKVIPALNFDTSKERIHHHRKEHQDKMILFGKSHKKSWQYGDSFHLHVASGHGKGKQ